MLVMSFCMVHCTKPRHECHKNRLFVLWYRLSVWNLIVAYVWCILLCEIPVHIFRYEALLLFLFLKICYFYCLFIVSMCLFMCLLLLLLLIFAPTPKIKQKKQRKCERDRQTVNTTHKHLAFCSNRSVYYYTHNEFERWIYGALLVSRF